MAKNEQIIEPINADFEDVVSSLVLPKAGVKIDTNDEYDYYGFDFDEQSETLWGTQNQISKIFNCSLSSVSEHTSNIYKDNELSQEETFRKFRNVSNQPIKQYNMDMIIAIGYRVNSKKATEFRRWATNIIKQYIKDGYIINEKRLTQDPEKLNELAAKIRALRAEEQNIYHSVRECFKIASSDYDPSSQEVKTFYATLQDKFHHAITELTSSKLAMDRANHAEENMGLQTFDGDVVTLTEAKIGKNYLRKDEIYRMHLLSEQFLLYAESTALRGKKLTMKILHNQLDNLLKLNDYPVFDGYKDYLKDKAAEHVKKEFEQYEKIQKLKLSGVNIDLEGFYSGAYDEQFDELDLAHKRLSTLKKNFEEMKIE
jgi:hypothetical protein